MDVRLTAIAESQLADIRTWIAEQADPATANRVAAELLARCLSLAHFPNRGTPLGRIRPGLRTIPHERRYTIGYVVYQDAVFILGIAKAGQDIESVFGGQS